MAMDGQLMWKKSMEKNNSYGSLDTNTLVRVIIRDIPEQAEAVEKLIATGQTFDISDIALIETIYVLERVYKSPRDQIMKSILGFVRNEQFNCNRILFELALPMFNVHPKLSFADCAILIYARLNKSTPLYSFDKELGKIGGDEVRLL